MTGSHATKERRGAGVVTGNAVEWRSHAQTGQWAVSIAMGDAGLGATWKGPAVTEEAARAHAMRDVPRILRAIAHLAGEPVPEGIDPICEMASPRLGESDDFRLAKLNERASLLLDAAQARCARKPAEADEAALALLGAMPAIGHSETDGIIHLSYGRLSDPGVDGTPSLIFDAHVLPYKSQDLLVLESWPETFGAAVIAVSALHAASGGRSDGGQVRRDIPESATARAHERHQARLRTPLRVPAIMRLMEDCGLHQDAAAFAASFGLPQDEEESA